MTTTEVADPTAILTRLDEARALVERFAGLGVTTDKLEFPAGTHPEPTAYLWADVRFTFFESGERCEEIAAALMDAYPDAWIDRTASEDAFTLTCPGRPSWSAYFSNSVCVKVQTGTRTKTVPDPVALEAVPLIEVEEPVYEWRCADPLADMAVTA